MFTFADSFDFYAANADMLAGYWDSGTTSNFTLAAGRFTGSRAMDISIGGANILVKSSGANDAIHHIVCAFRQTAALSSTSLGIYFQLIDNVTNQVCIVFRQDGAILLTSATPAGTVLATYSGAVTAQNTWFAFEFEVTISATVGRFRARKNGNTSDDFDSGATLNTRPGANTYANKLSVGMNNTVSNQQLDDLLWRSDPTSVAWMGDIRSYVRMPASDASVQFARSPNPSVALGPSTSTTVSKAANLGMMSAFTATYSGTIASGTVQVSVGGTGNMKAAIYDSTRAVVLATSNAVVNPVSGANVITFGTPLTVTKGAVYHLAVDQDFTIVYNSTSSAGWSFTTTFASFPAAAPANTINAPSPGVALNIVPTISTEFVNETLQDGTTSYVYDATVGHGDLYNIAAASPAPTSVVAVTTRGFIEKSDAGARSGAVQLKSGVTTAQSTSTPLASNFTWLYRTDSTDPNTGSAWTPAAVDGMQIGPVVTA